VAGSNQQSNSWNIDGIETSAPETGSSWMDVNPDNIEEVQIMWGLRVRKPERLQCGYQGGNEYHGSTFFWQTTLDTNVSARIWSWGDPPFQKDKF
jgi:hypothetical protein